MKRLFLGSALVLGMATCPAWPLMAQSLNLQHAEKGRFDVSLAVGLDPAAVTSLGITRWTGVGTRVMGLSVEASLPMGELDLHDYRAAVAASMSLFHFGSLHLGARLGVSARGTQNVHFTAHGFGADLAAFFGHYGRRTFAAVELGYDKAILEQVEHTPAYLSIYPEAVSGWYRGPAGIFRYGLTTGVSFGRVTLGLRAYAARSEGWKELIPPIGTTLSLSYAF